MNSVLLIGRLTKKPELNSTRTGTSVCNFTLAVDGIKKDEADFLDVTAFNKTAENLFQYKDKGDLIAVKGRLKKDVWQDNGQNRSRTYVVANEVQFLSSKKDNSQQEIQDNLDVNEIEEFSFSSDDLPF